MDLTLESHSTVATVLVMVSLAPTKLGDEVGEFEIVGDFDDTPPVGTARFRPWSVLGRSIQLARTASSILDEFGMVNIPRSHLAPIDPHAVLDGFLPTQVLWCLQLTNSRLGPQERAASLSATSGKTS